MGERGSAPLPIASAREVRGVIASELGRHPGRTTLVIIVFLCASALGLVTPASLGRIVDAVSTDAGFGVIAFWVAGVAAGAMSAALMAWLGARALTSLVQDILASLREQVFVSAMGLPVTAVDDSESADLLSRVTGDVDAVAEAGSQVVPTLLSTGFAVVVSIAALTAIAPWLAVAGIVCAPCYFFGARAFLRRSRVVFREIRIREAARSQAVLEAVEGVETLTALNEQRGALDDVARRAEASIRTQIDGVRLRNRLYRWINVGEAIGLAAILATGFVLHVQSAVTIGMVTAAALVFHRLFDPIGQLIFALDDIQRATIGLARLVGVIQLTPDDRERILAEGETASHPSASHPSELHPSAMHLSPSRVDLRDVSFEYRSTGRGVQQVTLRIDAGSTAAFVGTSGSGKSTLARIIAGQYEPTAGRLSIDPGTVPFYISQELHWFRGSVADNIRLAAPQATEEQIENALRMVGAEWALDTGLCNQGSERPGSGGAAPETPAPETPVLERASMDEGRIQQLAIARALVVDPALVILDEATADVGVQHRAVVESAIDALRIDRTVILIVHRLQHASSADQIVVFADGRIVQEGRHEVLRTVPGDYQNFWCAQEPSQTVNTDTHAAARVREPIPNPEENA